MYIGTVVLGQLFVTIDLRVRFAQVQSFFASFHMENQFMDGQEAGKQASKQAI